ncbi:pyridoxamine 5'-phosphate oxidase family protein [Fructobacillus sp. M158]|uniref:pyridoxamine 5'-phosphate oxidase family protein n=1 Tax=Fructobacillus parabroussonetiae TaxID=2713174 RepID=UPI002009E4B6|nr:pyridoxamine 5'-phosphate oxidase family protein [Fructobacillus parabroussonetiae]MCK8616997.1 pyridoxamine 5'-phosphate oxidase family protein [Fructobacillus parabroussonetiae]
MYPKRFIQLFLAFFVTILLSESLATLFSLSHLWQRIFFVTVIGYLLLVTPLTLMTIKKNQKKFSKETGNSRHAALSAVYEEVPNLVALATINAEGELANTLITFKPSSTDEQVWYLVTDRHAVKAADLRVNSACALTTWYAKSGLRLHSNQVQGVVLEDQLAANEIDEHPEILDLSDNARNQAVIKLTFSSIVIESFEKPAEMLAF